MAVNDALFHKLYYSGLGQAASVILSDDAQVALVTTAGAVEDQDALTADVSEEAPTKAEFDKVVADAVAARTTLNALLASLRTAGLLAE